MRSPLLFVCLSLATAGFAAAQQEERLRLLLPIVTDGTVAGENGSEWGSDVRMVNRGTTPVLVVGWDQSDYCPVLCPTTPLPPGITISPKLFAVWEWPRSFPVRCLLVPADRVEDVGLSVRIHERSSGLSTSLPVVSESQARPSFGLTQVVFPEGARQRLRIYDFSVSRAEAIVRVFLGGYHGNFPYEPGTGEPLPPDAQVGEIRTPFRLPDNPLFATGFAEIGDLRESLGLDPLLSYRIEVSSSDASSRLWGFFTNTRSECNAVELVTPH